MMVNMNIPNIDLHCHSTISDGLLSPRSLVSFAAEKNVSVLALTDHDDIAGLEQAKKYADELNIVFINGVEISVTWNKRTLHILGLNIDITNQELISGIRDGQVREGRENGS